MRVVGQLWCHHGETSGRGRDGPSHEVRALSLRNLPLNEGQMSGKRKHLQPGDFGGLDHVCTESRGSENYFLAFHSRHFLAETAIRRVPDFNT